MPALVVTPDGPKQPGDGYLAVSPAGVNLLTNPEWKLLASSGQVGPVQTIPRADWDGLKAQVPGAVVIVPEASWQTLVQQTRELSDQVKAILVHWGTPTPPPAA